jgi:hypothetical protein
MVGLFSKGFSALIGFTVNGLRLEGYSNKAKR